MTDHPTITVVVPTYRRPAQLRACLEGLAGQEVAPLQVVVARRPDDEASGQVLATAPLELTVVDAPPGGVLAAMGAGLAASQGAVIAFCDDDAVPRPEWIARLGSAFGADVVGVGGRDVLHEPDGSLRPTSLTEDVGRIGTFGRLTGNHHRGRGPARDVEVLKGVNCAYRRAALALPTGLRGEGAQVHFEVAIGLRLQRFGRLRYDPSIVVDHQPAPRFDHDARDAASAAAVFDSAFNLTLALSARSSGLVWRHVLYATVLGDRAQPGVLRAAAALFDPRDHTTAGRLLPALRGAWAGARAAHRGVLRFVTSDGRVEANRG